MVLAPDFDRSYDDEEQDAQRLQVLNICLDCMTVAEFQTARHAFDESPRPDRDDLLTLALGTGACPDRIDHCYQDGRARGLDQREAAFQTYVTVTAEREQ